MKNAQNIVVVDLGYGDSGKGTTVDYLTRKFGAQLNVRYNGGPQAWHTVWRNGRLGPFRHIFRQFGSGTLNNHHSSQCVETVIGPEMVINPLTMLNEADELSVKVPQPMHLMFVDQSCLVVTPFHRALNVIREHIRTSRHGSTGMGVGETRRFASTFSEDVEDLILRAGELIPGSRTDLKAKLHRIQRKAGEVVLELLRGCSFPELNDQLQVFGSNTHIEHLLQRYGDWAHSGVSVLTTAQIQGMIDSEDTPVIFEGAQGVLLDKKHGFHPYTTWTDTTPKPAFDLIDGDSSTVVLGVSRTFATRHGTGPFVTEGYINRQMIEDDDNLPGTYQGALRVGCLDVPALKYAMHVCRKSGHPVSQLAFTHCDKLDNQTTWPVCHSYQHGTSGLLSAYSCEEEASDAAAAFTEKLQIAKPVVTNEKTNLMFDRLAEHLETPITLKSFGKTSEDKLITP